MPTTTSGSASTRAEDNPRGRGARMVAPQPRPRGNPQVTLLRPLSRLTRSKVASDPGFVNAWTAARPGMTASPPNVRVTVPRCPIVVWPGMGVTTSRTLGRWPGDRPSPWGAGTNNAGPTRLFPLVRPAFVCGSPDWTRISNPSINSRMLCQLSYGGPLSALGKASRRFLGLSHRWGRGQLPSGSGNP